MAPFICIFHAPISYAIFNFFPLAHFELLRSNAVLRLLEAQTEYFLSPLTQKSK